MFRVDLTEQVAVITGGSSGIGLAAAELFLQAGAKVAICGRDMDRLEKTRVTLQTRYAGCSLLVKRSDVLNADDMDAFATAVMERFGRVDMLINNAGQGRISTFANTSDEAWREELELKYFSIIRPTRMFVPWLKDAPAPSIVCVNSLLALQPEAHMVATSSARAGVLNLVKSLAKELAPHRIRVNSILLGIVESGQWRKRFEQQAAPGQAWEAWSAELARKKNIPLGRLGRPEEPAHGLFYLATSLSSYTTGSHIDISGGISHHV